MFSYTYISVMFSMSSNVRTGKSSIPGAGSTQTILDMLQVQDAGQASPNLHSPARTTNNPRRAMPYPPAPESIAGSYDIPTSPPSPPKKPQNVVQLNYREDLLPRCLYPAKLIFSTSQEGRKKKTVGEECAEPTVVISRCHGLAFPSPQSRDHTTAYRCLEASVKRSAPRCCCLFLAPRAQTLRICL